MGAMLRFDHWESHQELIAACPAPVQVGGAYSLLALEANSRGAERGGCPDRPLHDLSRRTRGKNGERCPPAQSANTPEHPW